jgi:hypothetical protein
MVGVAEADAVGVAVAAGEGVAVTTGDGVGEGDVHPARAVTSNTSASRANKDFPGYIILSRAYIKHD